MREEYRLTCLIEQAVQEAVRPLQKDIYTLTGLVSALQKELQEETQKNRQKGATVNTANPTPTQATQKTRQKGATVITATPTPTQARVPETPTKRKPTYTSVAKRSGPALNSNQGLLKPTE